MRPPPGYARTKPIAIEIYSDKISYYLHHEDERREIAANGYQRIRQEYSYQARLALMLDVRHSLSI